MLISFTKMNAQGNDFVILNEYANTLPKADFPQLAKAVCNRNFGIGADGLVLLMKHDVADAKMVIYNSDGSRAEMCGSALRCVAQIMHQIAKKDALSIDTDSGIKQASVMQVDDAWNVTVNLGKPRLIRGDMCVNGFCGSLVDIGNPHYVVWLDSLEDDPHLKHGALLEHHEDFPTAVNVHFARCISKKEIEIKIWEHACGATLACGTGAVSTVFTGIKQGFLGNDVLVNMPGGSVKISTLSDSQEYLLSGTVAQVFSGEYTWRI